MPTSSVITGGISIFGASSNIIYIVVAVVLLLIVLMTLLLVLLGQKKKKREQEAQEALLAEQSAAEVVPATGKKPLESFKSIEEQLEESQVNSVKKQIEDFTDKKPELVAQILKNWLKD
jgi:flagellar M-ring protein FliF